MKASAKRSHSTSNASQTHSNLRQLPVELQYILSDTTKIIPHWKTTLQKKATAWTRSTALRNAISKIPWTIPKNPCFTL